MPVFSWAYRDTSPRNLFFALFFLPAFSSAATLSGTVTYDGPVPQSRQITMNTDPACLKKHEGSPKPTADTIVLGAKNELANVLVRVTSGLALTNYPAPMSEQILDQNGCLYFPKVVGVQVGQKLKIINSDPTFHNVHGEAKSNEAFNLFMPAKAEPVVRVFNEPEDPFTVECNVHPWMQGYVVVMEHPFFATTGVDGLFAIQSLPAGTYELEAWHPRLGRVAKTLTIQGDEKASLHFIFKKPSAMNSAHLDFVVVK